MLLTYLTLGTILTWSLSESILVCKSNMRPEGYVGPSTCRLKQDDMTFTCAVSFSGESPQMTWKILNDSQPFNESACIIESGRINCSVTIIAESMYDGSTFSCQSTKSTAECRTEIIKIQYFESHPLVLEKNISDKVNCSVKSNLELKFTWTRLHGDRYLPVVQNQTLSISTHGFYRCEVRYSIRNVTCKALESEVYVPDPGCATKLATTVAAVTAVTAGTSGTVWKAAAIVLIIVSVVSIIAIAVLAHCCRKKKIIIRKIKKEMEADGEKKPITEDTSLKEADTLKQTDAVTIPLARMHNMDSSERHADG